MAVTTRKNRLLQLDPPDLSDQEDNRQPIERAKRIRKAVQSAGGKKVVSDKTGIPMSTLGYYFTPHEVRLSVIEKLAEACSVSPGFLAFGAETTEGADSSGENPDADPGSRNKSEISLSDYKVISRFNVQASAGRGSLVDNEQIVEALAFSEDWLRTRIKRPVEKLLVIEARGDSMEPSIRDGDLLLLDVSSQEISSSAIHVIEVEGELLVKRLERRLNGSILVHSDNPRYAPQELTKADRAGLRIIGQVVWQGGPPRS